MQDTPGAGSCGPSESWASGLAVETSSSDRVVDPTSECLDAQVSSTGLAAESGLSQIMASCFVLLGDDDLVGLSIDSPYYDAAYSTLVERHERAVRHVAQGILGHSAGVDDVVQQTFIAAFRSLHTLKDRSRFKYWLRIIATNEARDHIKGNPETAELDELMILPERSLDRLPADYVEASWLLDELTIRLPEEYMKVLYLRYYLDYTVNEVAEMMGIRPGLVKWRANRARRLAQKALSDSEGGDSNGQTEPSKRHP